MTEKKGLLYGAIVAGVIFVVTLGIYNTTIITNVTGANLVFLISIALGGIAVIFYFLQTSRKTHLLHPTERGFTGGLAGVLFLLTTFATKPLLVFFNIQ